MGFNWEDVRPPVLKGLAAAAEIDTRQAASGLRARFGATPTEDFVHEMWSALRNEWLTRDRPAAKALAAALRTRGVGNTSIKPTNHEARLEYLRSCRNSKAVREETLIAFLGSTGGVSERTAASSGESSRKSKGATAAPPQTPATEFEDGLRQGLRALSPDRVPAIAASLAVIGSRAVTHHADDPIDQLVAGLASVSIGMFRNHEELIPKRLADGFSAMVVLDREILEIATRISRGALRWADHDVKAVVPLLFQAMSTITDDDRELAGRFAAVFAMTALEHMAGEEGRVDELFRIVDWSLAVMAAAEPTATSAGRTTDEDDDVAPHPAVVEIIRAVGEDENPFVFKVGSALAWLASSAGPTFVDSGDPVESRNHVVTPISVETAVVPQRKLTAEQTAAALSELNVRNGVSAAMWDEGTLRLHTAMASYPAIEPWLTTFMGAAMMSSAMTALHLPAELRGAPFDGPDGVRHLASHYVADYGGWDVVEEDQEYFELPSKKDIRAVMSALPVETDTRMADEEIVVDLPGPNGRLEGWLKRRRGRSDDHQLVVSKVTRPPWGAGVKLVLRVPILEIRTVIEAMAVLVNQEEYELVPSINIWGGWSGEDDALRLTMFVPQMLFTGSDESKKQTVANFAMYGIHRANNAALMFGLT
jgi:hypothetical protein